MEEKKTIKLQGNNFSAKKGLKEKQIQHTEEGLGRNVWAYCPFIQGSNKTIFDGILLGADRFSRSEKDWQLFDWQLFTTLLSLLSRQVKVYDAADYKHGPDDVLVMGTDGLWDVTTDREVADAVMGFLAGCEPNDPMRSVQVTQERL